LRDNNEAWNQLGQIIPCVTCVILLLVQLKEADKNTALNLDPISEHRVLHKQNLPKQVGSEEGGSETWWGEAHFHGN
jgi:hypothetical protein